MKAAFLKVEKYQKCVKDVKYFVEKLKLNWTADFNLYGVAEVVWRVGNVGKGLISVNKT